MQAYVQDQAPAHSEPLSKHGEISTGSPCKVVVQQFWVSLFPEPMDMWVLGFWLGLGEFSYQSFISILLTYPPLTILEDTSVEG